MRLEGRYRGIMTRQCFDQVPPSKGPYSLVRHRCTSSAREPILDVLRHLRFHSLESYYQSNYVKRKHTEECESSTRFEDPGNFRKCLLMVEPMRGLSRRRHINAVGGEKE